MERLPNLPLNIRMLTNAEARRLGPSRYTPSNCITCGGKGSFIASGGVETKCDCEDQWILHRYLLHCGVPTGHQRFRWTDASGVDKGALAGVSDWVENMDGLIRAGRGLLFTGREGTGKSLMAALLIKAVLHRGFTGHSVRFPGMVSTLIDSWYDGEKDDAKAVLARYQEVDVLVIDQVGSEIKQRRVAKGEGSQRASAEVALYSIETMLRHRVDMAKPSVVVSSLTTEEMSTAYGQGFASAVTEGARHIAFSGASFSVRARERAEAEAAAGEVRPLVLT